MLLTFIITSGTSDSTICDFCMRYAADLCFGLSSYEIIKPPDILVGGLVLLVFFFFFFFFRPLISELAERNSTKIGHMVGSKCNLKMHVQNLGYLLLLFISYNDCSANSLLHYIWRWQQRLSNGETRFFT